MEPRALFGRDFFALDTKSCALMVIDMQNEFVAPGTYYTAYPQSLEIIPNIERIIAFARKNSMPVVWTLCDHGFPGGGLILRKFPPIGNKKALWLNTESFELYPHMTQPLSNEYKIVKHKYDAFFGTDLDVILQDLKIESVIITGISTDICCESTARSAFHRDFQVAFVRDATATRTVEAHNATLRTIDGFFGRVLSTEDLLHELSGDTIQSSLEAKNAL